jgi:hypothetical protein
MTECTVDTSKSGYELAEEYDDCLIWEAQKSTAHIDPTAIEIRANETTLTDFGSSYAMIDEELGAVLAYYTFLPEDMSAYDDAPDSIDGIVMTKMKTKLSVDEAFDRQNAATQGLCVDVQETVYKTVLESILADTEREKYESEGLPLSFIPDDDPPPLGEDTNPVNLGQYWLPVDPTTKITSDDNGYYYEPLSLFLDMDHADAVGIEPQFVGVRYCKLLTHQAILSWMRTKSFESDPVLITPDDGGDCARPEKVETSAGSCLFQMAFNDAYYCSDYVGTAHDATSAQELCSKPSRVDSVYSSNPCSDRTAEIEAFITDYEELLGACIIRCGGDDEFLWNVYDGDLAERCTGYPYLTAAQLAELASE